MSFWYWLTQAVVALRWMLLLYLLAGQPGIGRGSSQADKQSADSSPDANDEQWLSQVSTSHSWLGGVDG